MSGEGEVRAHECSGKRARVRVSERGADLRDVRFRFLERRTRLRHLAALAAQEGDPEVRFDQELAIRLVGPGERTLDPLDVGARLVVGPAGLRAPDRRAQPQLGLRVVREGGGAIEERHGLAVREALQRVLARENEKFGRASRLSGLLEMHRDDRGELALSLRIEREQRLRGGAMQRPPILLEQ